jgi:1-phosphofructokinase family hexose kinase
MTPNPALDKIIFVDEWKPGALNRARKLVASVGGKGLDASVALRHLGQPTVGLHFAAGATGRELLELIERYGIAPEPIWVEGETRTAFIIAEEKFSRHTHTFTGGLAIGSEPRATFLSRYRRLLTRARWALTGGMLAPDLPAPFFRTLAEMAHAANVSILVDAARDPLRECLPNQPDIVKMNQDEFGWTFGIQARDLAELRREARQVFAEYAMRRLVITCGAEGILGLTRAEACHAVAPPQSVVNAAGAGDAASAALVWRLAEGDSWAEALRWTAAVSAASVLTEGTADLQLRDVRRLLPAVTVETWN